MKLIPLKDLINIELYEMYKDFPKEEIGSTNEFYKEDYINGIDTILEYALEYSKNKVKR